VTKDESRIKDWRSTGRRKGRRELYSHHVPYVCVGYITPEGTQVKCGKTVLEPPKDAPKWFDEIWPEDGEEVLIDGFMITVRRCLTSQLEIDHETKDFTDNTLEHLNFRCSKHHKAADRQTARGVAQQTTKIDFW